MSYVWIIDDIHVHVQHMSTVSGAQEISVCRVM
jgi:hypothetical protein